MQLHPCVSEAVPASLLWPLLSERVQKASRNTFYFYVILLGHSCSCLQKQNGAKLEIIYLQSELIFFPPLIYHQEITLHNWMLTQGGFSERVQNVLHILRLASIWSQTIADDRGSQIADRRRSQAIAEPTVAYISDSGSVKITCNLC